MFAMVCRSSESDIAFRSFAAARRVGIVKTQTIKGLRGRRPHTLIVLRGPSHQLGRQFDQVGLAQLQIEKLAQRRHSQRHLNRIQEWPSRPGFLIRAESQMRHLIHAGRRSRQIRITCRNC